MIIHALIRCNTLNHEEIGKNLQRISKIKHIIKKCNWKAIDYPSGINYQKKFEKNNSKIAVKVFYVEKMNMHPTYISNHNSNHENQIILLMIPNIFIV